MERLTNLIRRDGALRAELAAAESAYNAALERYRSDYDAEYPAELYFRISELKGQIRKNLFRLCGAYNQGR